MQTSKGERKHRDILLCIYFGKRYDHHIGAIVLIAHLEDVIIKREYFLFSSFYLFIYLLLLFFLTSGHKSSRYFCSFNLALGSQRDNYVATNSIIYYTVAFFIKSKKERNQKVRHDYVIDSKLSLNPFGEQLCTMR